jgi:predicted peptidase
MKIHPWIAALGLLILPACTTTNHEPKLTPGQTAEHFNGVAGKGELEYLAYVPERVAASPGKKFPAMLFLHGSGERGTNVWEVTKHGPPKIVKDKKDFPFLVFSPQCPPGQHWETDNLLALIQDLKKRYPIDENRLYLTGLSMGGSGTWNLILDRPDLFAAAVPICGRADTNALNNLSPEKLAQLRRLPIWVFHGEKDPTVPVEQSRNMAHALENIHANVKLTIYLEAVHDSWTQTYANPYLYDWLLAHNRKTNEPLKQ